MHRTEGMRSILLAFAGLCVLAQPAIAQCDAPDGPIVTAARAALRTGDFSLIVIWAQPAQERALRDAFRTTIAVRALAPGARELADADFVETAVRLHRESAGGVADPEVEAAADCALATGDPDPIVEQIVAEVRAGVTARLREARERRVHRRGDIAAGRTAVAGYLDFVHYITTVRAAAAAAPARHEEPIRHEH